MGAHLQNQSGPRVRSLHREAVQQFASHLRQKESKRLIIFVLVRREARFHGFRGPSHPHRLRRFRAVLGCRVGGIGLYLADLYQLTGYLPSGALPPKVSTLPAPASSPGGACGQSSSSSKPRQVQTSAQNPVFGSVPEAKPTPGVLPLTFSDAIERALRQNLAGLLSEYNTIEARGREMAEAQRPASERQRGCAGGQAENEPGSGRT